MHPDIPRALGSQQMHGVGDHHRALVEMMLMLAVRLPYTVRRRRKRCHKVVEVHLGLPPSRAARMVAIAIDNPL
jgi:hypothetical protein